MTYDFSSAHNHILINTKIEKNITEINPKKKNVQHTNYIVFFIIFFFLT